MLARRFSAERVQGDSHTLNDPVHLIVGAELLRRSSRFTVGNPGGACRVLPKGDSSLDHSLCQRRKEALVYFSSGHDPTSQRKLNFIVL